MIMCWVTTVPSALLDGGSFAGTLAAAGADFGVACSPSALQPGIAVRIRIMLSNALRNSAAMLPVSFLFISEPTFEDGNILRFRIALARTRRRARDQLGKLQCPASSRVAGSVALANERASATACFPPVCHVYFRGEK